jgi:hypothetical protein
VKPKATWVLSIGAVITGVILAMMAVRPRQLANEFGVERVSQPPPAQAPEMSPSAPPAAVQAAEAQSTIRVADEILSAPSNPMPAAPGGKAKKPLQDPAARVALSLVGADAEADQYWLAAIFDPTLPNQEREDLMEDLNEDGLSDPKHPGPEDVPLIVNRLQLIEEIAPFTDEFMQEHLGEAYKDLNNLLAGAPVP